MSSNDVSHKELIDLGKTVFGAGSGVVAMFMPLPLVTLLFDYGVPRYLMPLLFVPVVLISRGMLSLLNQKLAAKRPTSILLGAFAAGALLLVSPFSIWFALMNLSNHPSYLYFACAGTVIVLAYLVLAVANSRQLGSAT